ncbi:hypothetical protein ABZ915_13740 [Streptomyces sp. NPDC046915]|uniref:hypothetical protein n=1 Tax=Streptomyces sp. NPDC046915 TaxID=3155257 RepID=UPI0033E0A7EA
MAESQNIRLDDLTEGVTELTGEELELVVGGMPMTGGLGTGYLCTATQAGSSEDCWND